MGDKDFEDYLNGGDKNNGGFHEDKKRLLFDVLQLKMENTTNLIGIFSDMIINTDFDIKENIKTRLSDLMEVSDITYEQLDMLLSEIIDELNDSHRLGDEEE